MTRVGEVVQYLKEKSVLEVVSQEQLCIARDCFN